MKKITITTKVNKPVSEVWKHYNDPQSIIHWNFASDDWQCSFASNELKVGGELRSRMEAKDHSFGFDFVGIYDDIIVEKKMQYHLEDLRNVEINFTNNKDNTTHMEISFDPESQNPIEMQEAGWFAILNNFKKFVELQ